jgi:type VI secretion system protein ImpH
MATPRGLPDAPLERQLREEPYRFDFFQAVRLLEEIGRDRVPVGHEGPPRREPVRFLAARGLAFPASQLLALEPPADPESNEPARLTVAFMGLTGPLGVLPYCYTELVADRHRAGDRTLGAFLDLLNHRLISLFYRAWRKHQVAAAYEGGEDLVGDALLALVGLGLEPLRDRNSFPDDVPRFYAGFFAAGHRSPVALEAMLNEYFGLPITVEPFQGRWLRLDPADRSALGATGRHRRLGRDLVVGGRVWDEQGSFRLRLGPLSLEDFLAYQPGTPGLRAVVELTRLFVGPELEFDVQLVLKADDVPPCRLRAGSGAQLARTTWLKTRPFQHDADDAVLTPTA